MRQALLVWVILNILSQLLGDVEELHRHTALRHFLSDLLQLGVNTFYDRLTRLARQDSVNYETVKQKYRLKY